MYCTKCGTELVSGNNFCTNCGSPISPLGYNAPSTNTVIVPSQSVVDDGDNKATIWCVLSLILYFVVPVVFGFFASFLEALAEGLSYIMLFFSLASRIAAYVFMIMARVKYPDNKFAKILMWIYIVLFAFTLLLVILIVVFVIALIGFLST